MAHAQALSLTAQASRSADQGVTNDLTSATVQ